MMKVVLLCAGYGTRLLPLTENQPKSLLPVGSRPILDHLLEKIRALSSINEIFVVTNDLFFSHFEKWVRSIRAKAPITLVNDGTRANESRLGAIGDLGLVFKKHPFSEDVLVLAGDNLFDFSLTDFVKSAESHRPHASLGVVDIGNREWAKRYGVVDRGPGGEILEFLEKPETPPSTLVSTGIYWFPREKRDLLDRYIRQSDNADRLGDYIHWLLEVDQVFAYRFEGRWLDIGDLDTYREAERTFKIKKPAPSSKER